MKSNRNKTLEISEEDRLKYLDKIIQPTFSTKPFYTFSIYNEIINGTIEDVVGYLPKDFIDLLIIDPPYNLSKNYGNNTFKRMPDEHYAFWFDSIIFKLLSCMKKNASIYVCCDWKTSPLIYQVLKKYFIVQNRITWQRDKGRGSLNNWKNGMEDIWFATLTDKYYFNVDAVKIKRKVLAPYKQNGVPKDWKSTPDGDFRLTHPSNFWDDITIPFWSMSENTNHSTQKPEKLIAKLMLASSKEGDFIFDPFLGSGTTAVVASKLNRQFCGVEMNMDYCLMAQKRLDMVSNNKEIQGYKDGIFYERNSQPK